MVDDGELIVGLVEFVVSARVDEDARVVDGRFAVVVVHVAAAVVDAVDQLLLELLDPLLGRGRWPYVRRHVIHPRHERTMTAPFLLRSIFFLSLAEFLTQTFTSRQFFFLDALITLKCHEILLVRYPTVRETSKQTASTAKQLVPLASLQNKRGIVDAHRDRADRKIVSQKEELSYIYYFCDFDHIYPHVLYSTFERLEYVK